MMLILTSFFLGAVPTEAIQSQVAPWEAAVEAPDEQNPNWKEQLLHRIHFLEAQQKGKDSLIEKMKNDHRKEFKKLNDEKELARLAHIEELQKLEKENHQNFHESFMKDERPFDGNISGE